MNKNHTHTHVIIGGGASGVIAAYQLAHKSKEAIILIEPHESLGLGVAYATPYDWHFLNVPATRMLLDPNKPQLFLEWLQADPALKPYINPKNPGYSFVPRWIYGRFLQAMIQPLMDSGRVRWLQETAHQIQKSGPCLTIKTDKSTLQSKHVLLTIGLPGVRNLPAPSSPLCLSNPWDYEAVENLKDLKHVVIIGTGLTMVDNVLSLYHMGYKGTITAVSKHGLIPRSHLAEPSPPADLPPLPQGKLLALLQFIRKMAEQKPFQTVIDAVRPQVQSLWQSLSVKDQQRFLKRLSAFWDVHRHRIALEPASIVQQMITSKQLTILKGRASKVMADKNAFTVTVGHQTIQADGVINCAGFGLVPEQSPLIKQMLQDGLVELDAHHFGFKIGPHAESSCCHQLFIIGPLARGTLFEIIAVPEIVLQTKSVIDHVEAGK